MGFVNEGDEDSSDAEFENLVDQMIDFRENLYSNIKEKAKYYQCHGEPDVTTEVLLLDHLSLILWWMNNEPGHLTEFDEWHNSLRVDIDLHKNQ